MSAQGPDVPPRAAFRIELRPLREADEALYCGLYTDPETMIHIGPPLSASQAASSFRSALRTTAVQPRIFVVVEKATGATTGLCGWQRPDKAEQQVEIGILLDAQGRSRRYSIEAIAMVLDLAFAALPIDTVWVQYHRANAAADRLFRSLGMQLQGGAGNEGAKSASVVRSMHRFAWKHT